MSELGESETLIYPSNVGGSGAAPSATRGSPFDCPPASVAGRPPAACADRCRVLLSTLPSSVSAAAAAAAAGAAASSANFHRGPTSRSSMSSVAIAGRVIGGSGGLHVTLENRELWEQFDHLGTEMVITKSGRRMFPCFGVSICGLEPDALYTLAVRIVSVDNFRHKFLTNQWIAAGKAEKSPPPDREHVHHESPKAGSYWMRNPVNFKKLKLTNNRKGSPDHIVLDSLHKYMPELHIILMNEDGSRGVEETFKFPETSFYAVTAYQNDLVTQLKIDTNPFAKAFREVPGASDVGGDNAWQMGWRGDHYQGYTPSHFQPPRSPYPPIHSQRDYSPEYYSSSSHGRPYPGTASPSTRNWAPDRRSSASAGSFIYQFPYQQQPPQSNFSLQDCEYGGAGELHYPNRVRSSSSGYGSDKAISPSPHLHHTPDVRQHQQQQQQQMLAFQYHHHHHHQTYHPSLASFSSQDGNSFGGGGGGGTLDESNHQVPSPFSPASLASYSPVGGQEFNQPQQPQQQQYPDQPSYHFSYGQSSQIATTAPSQADVSPTGVSGAAATGAGSAPNWLVPTTDSEYLLETDVDVATTVLPNQWTDTM